MRSPSAFAARTPVRHPGRSSFIFRTIPWSSDMKTQSSAIPAASTISTTFSSRRTSWPYCFSSTTTLQRPLQTASASASVGTRSAANCAPTRLPMSTDADPRGVGLPDLHRVPGRLHQVAVVDDEDLAVGRLLDVELDVVGLLVGGEAERGERVLRGRRRRSAVRDHGHLLEPPGRHRSEEDEGGDGEDRDGGRRGEEARMPDERALRRRHGLSRSAAGSSARRRRGRGGRGRGRRG